MKYVNALVSQVAMGNDKQTVMLLVAPLLLWSRERGKLVYKQEVAAVFILEQGAGG